MLLLTLQPNAGTETRPCFTFQRAGSSGPSVSTVTFTGHRWAYGREQLRRQGASRREIGNSGSLTRNTVGGSPCGRHGEAVVTLRADPRNSYVSAAPADRRPICPRNTHACIEGRDVQSARRSRVNSRAGEPGDAAPRLQRLRVVSYLGRTPRPILRAQEAYFVYR